MRLPVYGHTQARARAHTKHRSHDVAASVTPRVIPGETFAVHVLSTTPLSSPAAKSYLSRALRPRLRFTQVPEFNTLNLTHVEWAVFTLQTTTNTIGP